jgi:hypothetical protein
MCNILAELWSNFRDDETMQDFIEYNDLGLPMAYFVAEKLVVIQPKGEIYITETFDLFMNALSITDQGFTELDQVFAYVQSKA